LEIPAGKIEVNEEPKETAIRELKEETGYEASNMEYMLEFYSSPGYCDEIIYIFLTDDVTLKEQELDENENIEVQAVQIDEVMKMIKLGKILDGKTIVGANIAKEYINSKKGR
ncbi:MAG TPA: NUDIX hydrolase, partial [Tissierellaceae bacterium]